MYPLRLDPELRALVADRAAAAGMSVNAFIVFALSAFVKANTAKRLGGGMYLAPIIHHNARCPCGSGQRYRNCCRFKVLGGRR
jgi:uncharacterized protein YchJ